MWPRTAGRLRWPATRVEVRLFLWRTKRPARKAFAHSCAAVKWTYMSARARANAWLMSFGRVDTGGPGPASKPDRTHFVVAATSAASEVGVSLSTSDARDWYANLTPSQYWLAGSARHAELGSAAAWAKEKLANGDCDDSKPFEPGWMIERRMKKERTWPGSPPPEPGDTAPGGQRY